MTRGQRSYLYQKGYRDVTKIICKRCIIDSSVPDAYFNDNGICNHCITYDEIDSRYRNLSMYPNQCNFVFNFSPSDNNFIFNTYKEDDIVILREKKIVIGNSSENDIGETFDNINTVYLDNVIVPVHSYEYNTDSI